MNQTIHPLAAITFDDGPSAEITPRVLDLLEQYHVPATFCVVGNNVRKHPELLRRMTEQGCEIANHSQNHERFTQISCKEIVDSITLTEKAIFDACGKKTVFIRPPYGAYDIRVALIAYALDKSLLLWNMDSCDWKTRDAAAVIPSVLRAVRDEQTILLHDLYLSSYEAAAVIIPELQKRGYELTTAEGILKRRGIPIVPGQCYFPDTGK